MNNQASALASNSILLSEIVDFLNAELHLPEGTEALNEDKQFLELKVIGIDTLANAKKGQISFFAHKKYLDELLNTDANAVIISEEFISQCPVPAIVVKDAYLAFAKVTKLFELNPKNIGVHPTAVVAKTAKLAQGVTLGAHVVIGEDCSIGKNTRIEANTVVEEGCIIGENTLINANVFVGSYSKIGNNVRIHSQASIGSDGFGFAPNTQNGFEWERIAQLGAVTIGNDVRIGANTCVDRGALGDTIIEDGVIIDNLVQIAHNVRIGQYTAIAACTGISGSTTIGKNCIIAGGVGIAGHLNIVDGVTITGMTIITGSITKPGSYSSGTTTMPTKEWRKAAVNFKKLANSPFKRSLNEISHLKTRLKSVESRLQQLLSK